MRRIGKLFIFAILSTVVLFSQQIKVAKFDGGSVATDLGYGLKVNDQSTLIRSWIVLNDSGCPIQLFGSGIKTIFGDREYKYIPDGSAYAKETVTAFDIRFLLYDIFGNYIKTLTGKQVKDIQMGTTIELENIGNWRTWENEVSDLLTIVSFVAQVRSSSGVIWKCDTKLLSEELSKNKFKISNEYFEPSKEK